MTREYIVSRTRDIGNNELDHVTGSVHRIPLVTVRRKYRQDIFNPFTIIGMFNSIDMGKDVGIMPVGFLCTGSVGMLHLMVLRFKRVRQVSYLLFPYRFKYLVMGPEFIDSDNPAPELSGLTVIDQHPVAEKFPADGGAVRVDYAENTRAVGLPVRKYTPFLGGILTFVLHFLEFIGKFIDVLGQHVNTKEFIGDPVPAKIFIIGHFSLNFYELPKAFAALPAAVALKFHHSKIHFMLILIIKIGI
jgi:hypothetical protein